MWFLRSRIVGFKGHKFEIQLFTNLGISQLSSLWTNTSNVVI